MDLPGVRLLNPRDASDREEIVAAIRSATELATAIPSVELYGAGGDASVASLLAEGAAGGHGRVLYAAENNNYAASRLLAEIEKRSPSRERSGLQALDTVIGKMSGVVTTAEEMRQLGLAPLVPGLDRCVLVEEFNRILISKITLPGFTRGIRVFEEKDDLIPFEEAKLYGHNAVHALLGYLARLRGHRFMSSIREDGRLLALGRRAFLHESGAAMVRRHGSTGDALFTAAGWEAYADDLLQRMTNPYLHDDVERIVRDPRRKLGWSDRFFGTMRAALEAGIRPTALALGAAAAAVAAGASREKAREHLLSLWGSEPVEDEREACLSLVMDAMPQLDDWRA
jgi:mannitol-1-phosphate 5-dehydrogenase